MKRSFFQDILGVLSSNIITLIINLLIGIIIARSLGPDVQGLYKSVLIVPLMIVSLAELGIRQSTMYYLGQNIYSINKIFTSLIYILIFTSSIGVLISYSILSTSNSKPDKLLIFFAISYIPIKLLVTYISGIFLGKEDIKEFNKFKWIPSVFNLIGLVFFVLLLEMGIEGALSSFLIANIFFAFYAVRKVLKLINFSFEFDYYIIKNLLKLGFFYALSLFVIQLNYKIDILLLSELSNLNEVGYYGVGVSFSELIWQIPTAFGIVIMSRAANSNNEESINISVNKLLRISLLIGLVATVGLYILAPILIPLVYGDLYEKSIDIVQIILPGILFFIVFKVLNSRLAGKGKPEIALFVFAPSVIINILLNIIWIPKYGGIGSAWATNVSYIFSSIILIIVYSKKMNTTLKDMFYYKKSDFNVFVQLYNKFFQKK